MKNRPLCYVTLLLISSIASAEVCPNPTRIPEEKLEAELYTPDAACRAVLPGPGEKPAPIVFRFDGLPVFRSNQSQLLYGYTEEAKKNPALANKVVWLSFKGDRGDAFRAAKCAKYLRDEWEKPPRKGNPEDLSINAVGYSYGGPAAVLFARKLNDDHVTVNNLIALDPVNWATFWENPQFVNPENVKNCFHSDEGHTSIFIVQHRFNGCKTLHFPISEENLSAQPEFQKFVSKDPATRKTQMEANPDHLGMPSDPVNRAALEYYLKSEVDRLESRNGPIKVF